MSAQWGGEANVRDGSDGSGTLGDEPRTMLSAGGVVSVLFVTTLAMVFGVVIAFRVGTPQVVRLGLGSGGFTPAAIEVEAGRPVELEIVRMNAAPCTDSVVLENPHISRALTPLKTTAVDFTPRSPGDYTLRCGMGCWKATLRVREQAFLSPSFFE